jgi:hypothetical protein
VNVVKANVPMAVVFVIMASMANIVGLMLVDLIAILMEFVKICLKRINDRNMSANAWPDGRVNIAKSPKRWTVRMKWTMIIMD